MASFDPVAPTAPSTKAPADEKAATSVRSFSLSTTKGDIPAVLDTLSLAFEKDPIATYFSKGPSCTVSLARAQFALTVSGLPVAQRFFATASLHSAVLAMQYPQDRLSTLHQLWLGQWRMLLFSIPLAKWGDVISIDHIFLQRKDAYLKEHGLERMLYIYAVGVHPEHQNKGLGSTLLRKITTQADSEGQHVYLEATSEANKRLYERHGFREVSGEWKVKPHAPTVWFMARPPSTT